MFASKRNLVYMIIWILVSWMFGWSTLGGVVRAGVITMIGLVIIASYRQLTQPRSSLLDTSDIILPQTPVQDKKKD